MSDPDESIEVSIVAPSSPQAYDEDIRRRAYVLWSTICNMNANAVEWMLEQEARRSVAGTDQPIPAWPAASTIRYWAKIADWTGAFRSSLAESLDEDDISLKIKSDRLKHMAADGLTEVMLGRYDENPGAGALRIKGAELAWKMTGRGTFGANSGGEERIQVTDLVGEDDVLTEELDPMKRAAINRSRNQEDKRRG